MSLLPGLVDPGPRTLYRCPCLYRQSRLKGNDEPRKHGLTMSPSCRIEADGLRGGKKLEDVAFRKTQSNILCRSSSGSARSRDVGNANVVLNIRLVCSVLHSCSGYTPSPLLPVDDGPSSGVCKSGLGSVTAIMANLCCRPE